MLKTLCTTGLLSLSLSALATEPKVFLTFDDGPVDATIDVLEVLNEQNIKATFYINAWHLDGIGDENEDRALEALQLALDTGHVIANHSYDHMIHNCVDEFGPNSARECNETAGWSINAYQNPEEDVKSFAQNIEVLKQYIPNIESYPNYQADTLARLPYTNNWRLTKQMNVDAFCATRDFPGQQCEEFEITDSSHNGMLTADLLADQGYQVAGWNLDMWDNMSFEMEPSFHEEWASWYVYDTIYDEELCLEQWYFGATTYPCYEENQDDNKTVVLTHDFLYEDSYRTWGKTNNLEVLRSYISQMKELGYKFDTMDNYYEGWVENTDYVADDLVSYEGKIYRALSDHKSQDNWNPSQPTNLWAQDSASISWMPTGQYLKGDYVEYKGKYYHVIADHNANLGWTPDVANTLFTELTY